MIDTVKTGKKIALLRKEKGLTGEKLAALLDVSPQAIQMGKREMPAGDFSFAGTGKYAGLQYRQPSDAA